MRESQRVGRILLNSAYVGSRLWPEQGTVAWRGGCTCRVAVGAPEKHGRGTVPRFAWTLWDESWVRPPIATTLYQTALQQNSTETSFQLLLQPAEPAPRHTSGAHGRTRVPSHRGDSAVCAAPAHGPKQGEDGPTVGLQGGAFSRARRFPADTLGQRIRARKRRALRFGYNERVMPRSSGCRCRTCASSRL